MTDRPPRNRPTTPAAGRWLLEQAAAGSESAWAALVARHAPDVWRTVRSTVEDHAAAVDICQVVWLRLVDALSDPPRDLAAWLKLEVEGECRALSRDLSRGVLRGTQRTSTSHWA